MVAPARLPEPHISSRLALFGIPQAGQVSRTMDECQNDRAWLGGAINHAIFAHEDFAEAGNFEIDNRRPGFSHREQGLRLAIHLRGERSGGFRRVLCDVGDHLVQV